MAYGHNERVALRYHNCCADLLGVMLLVVMSMSRHATFTD
jgi:hypothetical protein